MDTKDKYDSQLTKQSKTRRSIFDFSSVEDLRQTNEDQDSDPFPSDKTQPMIPFNESYIAHAPSRHSFTLNSRYTYFGGYGASSKDISGSVEDLTGYTRKKERNLSLSKFSKSSPDLFGASYQSSDGYDVTEQKTQEDFVMNLDIESNFENENESEHGNEASTKRGENSEHGNGNVDGSLSITETKLENDPKVRLETKWATKTEHEARSQLSISTLKIENTKRNTTFVGEVKREGLSKTNAKDATTHVQNPGTNDDADVSSTAEKISVVKNYEEKSDIFDKGWKTILYSGKAELRKSLESLSSFRQDVNSREIQNVKTFESESFVSVDSVALQQSVSEEGSLEQARELVEMSSKEYDTGVKRDDEIAELNTIAFLRSGKRQKISQESEGEMFSQTSEGNSSICESDTTAIKQSYDRVTTNEDSIWTTLKEEKYTTDVVNTKHATTTLTREETANRNEEKQAALRIINSQNDNVDLSTSREELAGVNKPFEADATCSSSDIQIFHTNYRNISTSKVREIEGNYEGSLSTSKTTNSTDNILQMEETTGDYSVPSSEITVDNEGYSRTIIPPSCNISPITLRVLNNSTSCDENKVWQDTAENRGESANATVKVSGIRQSSICVKDNDKMADDLDQSLLNSSVKMHEPNNNWLNDNTDQAETKSIETPQETTDHYLVKNMMGMFCLLGLKDSPEGGFYSNGQEQYRELRAAKDSLNVEQEMCVEEKHDQTLETDLDLPENIEKKLFTSNENETVSKENESLIDIEAENLTNWEQQDKGGTNVNADTELGDCNNTTVEEINTQHITLHESPATIEGNIGDLLTRSEKVLEEKKICDKDFLLSRESDTTLYKSDIQNGKQEKLVEYRNIKGNIDEGIILQTAMTQDFLFQISEDSKENLTKHNEVDVLQQKEERIVELDMRENDGMDFTINAADLLMTSKEEEFTISQERTTEPSLKNTMTTTNLEVNRNKWSHAYIIPPRSMNVYHPETFSGAFNILVLDSKLIPTSPERKSTVVTLNLFPHETEGEYSRGQDRKLSQVDILVNVEQLYPKVDKSNSDVVQEDIGRNSVEEHSVQTNHLEQNLVELEIMSENNSENHTGQVDHIKQSHDEILTSNHKVETTGYSENLDIEVDKDNKVQHPICQIEKAATNTIFVAMGKLYENSLPDSEEKTLNDPIAQVQNSKNMEPDCFWETDYQIEESVQKVDFKAMTDKRLSEHLMCFEMDKLIDERITKQESMKQENLFSELDEILLPGSEIREAISKEQRKDVQYDLLSELDGFFISEEMQENDLKHDEKNNNVILSEVDEQVYSSGFTMKVEMAEKTQTLEELYSLESKNEVPEVITKTVHGERLEYKDLSQLDDVLKTDYVQEIISDKVKVQFDKQDYFSETDKYFDSMKTVQQHITEEIDDQQLEQPFESPKQSPRPELQVTSFEKTIAVTSRVILLQNNEEIEIVQTEKEGNSSNVNEQKLQENAWEITVNNQEVLPETDVIPMASKYNGLSNTNGDDLILMISHPSYSRNPVHQYGGDDDGDNIDDDGNDDGGDNNDMMQCTASPIPDDLSSIASNYDASAESSSEINGEDSLIDDEVEHVPWDVTVSYSNPETMKSEYKILRASYSNIQPEVYQVESETPDGKVTVDGKNICGKTIDGETNSSHIQKQPEICEQVRTTVKLMSLPKKEQSTEDNFNINIDVSPNGYGNQYRTTMDIQQNQNQVNTSYVLFQRFGKEESPRTYFELNYDMDKWKVGEQITSHTEEDPEKTFVVSYATIEQVNLPPVAPVYFPTIEEETYDADIGDIQATQLPNESEQIKIEFLQSSPPLPPPPLSPPQTPSLSSSPLPPPRSLPPPSPPTSPAQTPPASPSSSPLPPPPPPASPPTSPPRNTPPLPTTTTTKAGTLEVQQEETNLYAVHNSPEISVQKELCPENTPYPLLQPPTTNTEEIQQAEINHHLTKVSVLPDELSLENLPPPLLQTPPTNSDEVQQKEIDYHLPQKSTPRETQSENLEIKIPPQLTNTVHSQVLPPVSESRPPVWSFAQSVFHTDGQSKTFFKVIDNRKKSFQSSTFMYRGERVKVSRGVNVFKNYIESSERDIGNEQSRINNDYEGYQIMDSRENEDYVGYSEIWDEGNQMTVDNEVMVEVDGPITRSTMVYDMATEQDLFDEQESRNCSWHLNLHGSHGVCEISPNNLDAIAKEDDNTLLGSKGFVSGHHAWVMQGLGIFCAVGVCYSGEEVGSWYKGGKWVWTTDGLMYSEPTGIRRSEFGQWRNEDVLEITLDCEEQKLTIVNTRTNVEASLHGFQGEVYPYFNIYKGSCIRLLETS